MMDHVALALSIAVNAHENQCDKGGAPYIHHVLRVANQMSDTSSTIAALLHDVVEDGDWTCEQLADKGFAQDVVEAVDCLTRREGEDYKDFIQRCAKNPIAVSVKIADLRDNLNPSRLSEMTPKDYRRMEKYRDALLILGAVDN